MNISIKSLTVACAIAIALLAATRDAGSQQAMTIILSGKYMLTGDSAVVEVMDINCNKRILGPFTLAGNQEIPLFVCRDRSGYAHVATRNVSNNGDWHGSGLLREREPIYP